MAIIHSGEMDQLIALQTPSEVDDGAGGQDVTWTTIDNEWASVRPGSGGEQQEHDQIQAPARVIFGIHNRTDITEKDRVVWDGVNYNIRHFLNRGARPWFLEFEAERDVAI